MPKQDSNRRPCDPQSGDISTRPRHLYCLMYIGSIPICIYVHVEAWNTLQGALQISQFNIDCINLHSMWLCVLCIVHHLHSMNCIIFSTHIVTVRVQCTSSSVAVAIVSFVSIPTSQSHFPFPLPSPIFLLGYEAANVALQCLAKGLYMYCMCHTCSGCNP